MLTSSPKFNGEPTPKALASGLATLGRYGDEYMVHAAEGETMIPPEVFEANPGLRDALFRQMQMMGIKDPNRFVVGNAMNSINPITGQPEFFFKKFFKSVKKIFKKVAPIIAPIIGNLIAPGIGGIIASGLVTKLQGGSWGDVLKGAAIGVVTQGGIGALTGGLSGTSFGNALGIAPGGTFSSGLKQGLFSPFQAAGKLFSGGAANPFSQGIFGTSGAANLPGASLFSQIFRQYNPNAISSFGPPVPGAGTTPTGAPPTGAPPSQQTPAFNSLARDRNLLQNAAGEVSQVTAGEAVSNAGSGYTMDDLGRVFNPQGNIVPRNSLVPVAPGVQAPASAGLDVDSLSTDPGFVNMGRFPADSNVSSPGGMLSNTDPMYINPEPSGVTASNLTGNLTGNNMPGDTLTLGDGSKRVFGTVIQKDGTPGQAWTTPPEETGFFNRNVAEGLEGLGVGPETAAYIAPTVKSLGVTGALGAAYSYFNEEDVPDEDTQPEEYRAYDEWNNIADKDSPAAIALYRKWYGQPYVTRSDYEERIGGPDPSRPDWWFIPEGGAAQTREGFGAVPSIPETSSPFVPSSRIQPSISGQQAGLGGILSQRAQPIQLTANRGGEVMGPGTGTSDSIPARLSDGEFVMTANAVRNAGNGNRDVGAARMYDMMRRFEGGTA